MKENKYTTTEPTSSHMTVDDPGKCRTDVTSWSNGVVKTAVRKSARSKNKQKREKNKRSVLRTDVTPAVDLTVKVGAVTFKNPFVAASGTYGFGREAAEFLDLSIWGGISSKGVTLEPRAGNPPPRVAETPCGMLNAVGLQNPGVEAFMETELPFMLAQDTITIVNVAGSTEDDYEEVCRRVDASDAPIIELNLSCPNVRTGGMTFGADPGNIESVTKRVRMLTDKQLWVKLTPNVTSITDAAKAAEAGGADAVSLINTLLGMSIDAETRRPILHNNTGGLSGPAVKPIALRMVNEVYRAVRIPVVGLGGIRTALDAVEFMIAGASAVQIGTFNLISPTGIEQIMCDFETWLTTHQVKEPCELIGTLNLW